MSTDDDPRAQDAIAAQQAHDAEREADTPESLAANASPTERQVDAALAVLREEFDIGRDVLIGDYINSRTDPPPGPERDAALAAFRAANEAAEERVRAVIRRALEASAPDPINEPREA